MESYPIIDFPSALDVNIVVYDLTRMMITDYDSDNTYDYI